MKVAGSPLRRRPLAAAACLTLGGLLLVGSSGAGGSDPVRGLCDEAERNAAGGRITAAVLAYNRAIATAPENARPYIGIAVLYEALSRADLAVEALRQIERVDPDAPHLHCRLTEAHLGVEDVRAARDLGAEAVVREPNCARAFSNYGIALARSRYWQSAALMLRRARQLAPEDTGLAKALVDVEIQQGAFDEAARLGEELLRTTPESPELRFNTGVAYAQQPGRPESVTRAVEHLARAAELSPDWFQPHAELGRLYQGLGRPAEAAAAYEQAWRLRPGSPGVAYNLALLWRRLGDPRAGELERQVPRLARDATRLDVLRVRSYQAPEDRKNLLATAETEAEQGQFGPALFRLRKLLARDPADLQALKAYRRIDRLARSRSQDYLRPGPGATAL
jgi:Flp pilus assembly protein TadD